MFVILLIIILASIIIMLGLLLFEMIMDMIPEIVEKWYRTKKIVRENRLKNK